MPPTTSFRTISEQAELFKNQLITALVRARQLQHMSQNDLADGTGLSQSVIARFENKKNNPTLKTLLTVVAALGVSLEVKD